MRVPCVIRGIRRALRTDSVQRYGNAQDQRDCQDHR
jgi:hypothetical protein